MQAEMVVVPLQKAPLGVARIHPVCPVFEATWDEG